MSRSISKRPSRRAPTVLGTWRLTLTASLLLCAAAFPAAAANCGPFADVADSDPFCPAILEVYALGISAGTSSTTFGPTLPVTRRMLALLLARTAGSPSAGGSNRRAALGQFWTPADANAIRATSVGGQPRHCRSDGADVWVANQTSGTVSRVRASDGKLLETRTNAADAFAVLVAKGFVYVTGDSDPGTLYFIDPMAAPGNAVLVTNGLPPHPVGLAFDGARVWTANGGGLGAGSVTIIPCCGPFVTVNTGFAHLSGILFDGANMWVTDNGASSLLKLDANGAVLQTVPVGATPSTPVFDGTNIWVPNLNSNSVTVVRAASGAVIETLTGNGLDGPAVAAFDGQRILVTNVIGDSVSIWRASDLAPLGAVSTGENSVPYGACSDGLGFWVSLVANNGLGRF